MKSHIILSFIFQFIIISQCDCQCLGNTSFSYNNKCYAESPTINKEFIKENETKICVSDNDNETKKEYPYVINTTKERIKRL